MCKKETAESAKNGTKLSSTSVSASWRHFFFDVHKGRSVSNSQSHGAPKRDVNVGEHKPKEN